MLASRVALLLLLLGAPCAAQPEPSKTPRLMGPRRGPEKEAARKRHGGTEATEKAVAAGLDWLARHQEASGLWDADAFMRKCAKGDTCTGKGRGQHGEDVPCPFDHAISALATLAFLGAGIVPNREGKGQGPAVERALAALRQGGRSWGFVLATQALAEAEALTGDGRFRAEVHARAGQILRMRGDEGAWGYYTGSGRGADVPFTALCVQALLAARDTGFVLPEDLGPRLDAWLSKLEIRRGRLAYLLEGRRFGYTPTSENAACAAALRELLGVGCKSRRHRSHLSLLAKQRPRWKLSFEKLKVPGKGVRKVQVGHLSLYRWWYGTLATFHHGGSAWSAWNQRLKKELMRKQHRQACARGSWDAEGLYERQTGGRVFATALAVLMLEQPYRHVPR